MTSPACARTTFEELTSYAAGELSAVDASSLEDHLFSCAGCAARAAEIDALVRAIRTAFRSSEVGGFVTDEILNRLAREGARVRTFVLSPGAVVPCAVWEGDELMVLRLRGDVGDATEVALSQRVGGREISRATSEAGGWQDEVVFATPASWIRDLPIVDIELRLTALSGGEERAVGSYTLAHGGLLG
jgi:anti-sigma factor RsiW